MTRLASGAHRRRFTRIMIVAGALVLLAGCGSSGGGAAGGKPGNPIPGAASSARPVFGSLDTNGALLGIAHILDVSGATSDTEGSASLRGCPYASTAQLGAAAGVAASNQNSGKSKVRDSRIACVAGADPKTVRIWASRVGTTTDRTPQGQVGIHFQAPLPYLTGQLSVGTGYDDPGDGSQIPFCSAKWIAGAAPLEIDLDREPAEGVKPCGDAIKSAIPFVIAHLAQVGKTGKVEPGSLRSR